MKVKSITFTKSDGSLLELSFEDCKMLANLLSEMFKSEPLVPTYPSPVYPNPIMPPFNPTYPTYPYVTWDNDHTYPTQLLRHYMIPTLTSSSNIEL